MCNLVIILITFTPYGIFFPLAFLFVTCQPGIVTVLIASNSNSLQLPDPNKNRREEETEKTMILAGKEDEDKWLAEGIAGIQHNAFYMHRALVIN
jgi:hypothetical protein